MRMRMRMRMCMRMCMYEGMCTCTYQQRMHRHVVDVLAVVNDVLHRIAHIAPRLQRQDRDAVDVFRLHLPLQLVTHDRLAISRISQELCRRPNLGGAVHGPLHHNRARVDLDRV